MRNRIKNHSGNRVFIACALLMSIAGAVGAQTPAGPGGEPAKPAAPAAEKLTVPALGDKPSPVPPAPKPPAPAEEATGADLPKNDEEVLVQWENSVNGEERRFKLNFRGASLKTVLDYLSRAAGFIIVGDPNVSGTIDVYSHQPVSKDEAIELLNTILNDKGYAAVRNGRILKIIDKDLAKYENLPVIRESDPKKIPRSDEMVTQIIPIRYASAVKLIENLKPLVEEGTVMTANEDGNAILITDTQTNIRRMAEIIAALDTSISSISSIQVFPLQFADATEMAEVVNKVFEVPTSGRSSSSRSREDAMRSFMSRMRGGDSDRGSSSRSSSTNTGTSQAQSASTRVSAVADTRSNSLVVSAPKEALPEVEELIALLDTQSTDKTEIRVFQLEHADAEELADLITEVFEEDDRSSGRGRGGYFSSRFGGGSPFGGFGGGRPGGSSRGGSSAGQRQLAEAQIVAVADIRTNSLIVTASGETMEQIAQMIEHLDKNPAKQQKIYVHEIKHGDAAAIRNILESMMGTYGGYGSSGSRGSSSSRYPSSGRSSSSSPQRSSSGGFGTSSSNFSRR